MLLVLMPQLAIHDNCCFVSSRVTATTIYECQVRATPKAAEDQQPAHLLEP